MKAAILTNPGILIAKANIEAEAPSGLDVKELSNASLLVVSFNIGGEGRSDRDHLQS